MLIGEYEHTLDDKKRVTLPKPFAKALGKKMVITRGLDACLFLFAEDEWKKVAEFKNWQETAFEFRIDQSLKQSAKAREMRLSPAECVKYASQFFALKTGDLIFTGTPKGVGPLVKQNRLLLAWNGMKKTLLLR